MTNNAGNFDGYEERNQRIGRELYDKDKQYDQRSNQRYGGYRGDDDRKWGEGNFFHTGPNPHGAQDHRRPEHRGGSSNSSYHVGDGAHLNDHYGSRPDSPYRNERAYLNHGDSHSTRTRHESGNIGGSAPGNYNEPPRNSYEAWNETPGGRSRYKESDYRYGSGSHNWYREGRYTPNEDDRVHHDDNRGFFQRMGEGIRDTWNDIMHSDDPNYHSRSTYDDDRAEQLSSRKRYGSELYRNRNFDNGYEGGPRWADETDSGRDNYYDDIDRTKRYRR